MGNLLASAAEHSDGAAPVIGGQPSGGFAGPSLAAPVETAVQGVSEPGSGAAPVMLPAAQLAALWSAANGTLLRVRHLTLILQIEEFYAMKLFVTCSCYCRTQYVVPL